MLSWPSTADATLVVQGIGFWLNLVSFLLTIGGLIIAIRQINKTVRSTEAVKLELNRIRGSLQMYDANAELAKSAQALTSARKHLSKKEWLELHVDYADFQRSVHIVKALTIPELNNFNKDIDDALAYANRLCERIDAGGGSPTNIDLAKTGTAIRDHENLISSLNVLLQGKVIQ